MAVYIITGNLGAGKSLCSVGRIEDYLLDNRRVATNLDLNIEHLTAKNSKSSYTRLPDKPRISDLELLGKGYEGKKIDEKRNGLLVLDEMLDFFDSRSWRDPERAPLLSWFRHSRKHRWDILFLAQDVESLDGQLVRQLCEHLVICRRLDRVKLLGFTLPRLHVAQVYYAKNKSGPAVDRWMYKGTRLFNAYDTEQCFTDQKELFKGNLLDMRAPYSALSHWHLVGRYDEPKKKNSLTFSQLIACIPWLIAFPLVKLFPRLTPYF